MSKKKKKADDEEAEATETTTSSEGGEGEEGEGGHKKGKKKLIIIIAAVLVLAGIGAGVAFSGILGGGGGKAAEHVDTPEEAAAKEAAAALAAKPVYYELPQFLVNLNSTTSRGSFLKMSVTLQLRDAAAVKTMDDNKPRIQDTFNTYLRELRPADVQGSEGLYRLRTELITRLNSTLEEGIVKDVLFGEIIVQ